MNKNLLPFKFCLMVTIIAHCQDIFIPAKLIGKVESKDVCPGFLQNDPSIPCWILSEKCYCFSTEKRLDWSNADTFCRDENMNLLTIENSEENQLICNQVKSISQNPSVDYYWTSGKYSNNRWEWASTEPFQPMAYTNWYTGEPSNSQIGSFAYINFNFDDTGYWFDEIGSSTYILFICESIDGGTAETTTDATTTLLSSTTNGNLPTTVQSSTTPTTAETEYTTSRTTPGSNEVCLPYNEGNHMNCNYWNETCYCFSKSYLLWTEGEAYCKSKNMTLLAVETEEEDRMIYQNCKEHLGYCPSYFWTAGRYSPINDRWEWATTEPFPPMNHTNFRQSVNDDEFCYDGGSYSEPFCTLFSISYTYDTGYWTCLPCNITNSHNSVACEK